MRTVFSLLVLLLFSGFSIACDYQNILAEAERTSSHSRIFSAINIIEEGVINCYHPRLSLELGELYASLGQFKKAILLWQESLVSDELPSTVATKVKLRILQLSVAQKNKWSNTVLLSAGAKYKFGIDTITNLNVSGFSRLKGNAKNFFGYALYPSISGQLSASNLRYIQVETTDNLLSLESTAVIEIPLIETSIGARVQNINGTSDFYFVNDVRLGIDRFNTSSAFSWQLDGSQWNLEQSLNIQIKHWRGTVNVDFLSQNDVGSGNSVSWDEVSAKVQQLGRFKPALKVDFSLPSEAININATLRYPFNASNWLTFKATLEVTQTNQWASSFSYTWRPI